MSVVEKKWRSASSIGTALMSAVNSVTLRTEEQKEHLKAMSLNQGYIGFLKHFEVEYDEQYLFEWID